MESLGFEHGNLEYFANMSWSISSKLLCVPAGGFVVTAMVMELCGSLCKVWRRAGFPVTAMKVPGPGGGYGTRSVPWCSGPSMPLAAQHHPQQLPCRSTHPAMLLGQRREVSTAGAANMAVAKSRHSQKEALGFYR